MRQRAIGTMLCLMMAVAFLSFVPPVSAAPTLFWVDGAAGCDSTWLDADCWSLTSGGSGGAGPPTASNDVVFDAGFVIMSDSQARVAHDVTILSSVFAVAFDFGASSTLTIHSMSTGEPSTGISSNNLPGLTFTGTIATFGSGSYVFNGGGLIGNIRYTGTASAGEMSGASMSGMFANGKTIYCAPGCTNDGGNTNIIFTACPGTSCDEPLPVQTGGVCDLDSAIPGISLTTLFIVMIGVGVLLAILAYFGFFGSSFSVGGFTVEMLSPARVVTGIVGVIVISFVLAAVIPRMTC